MATHLEEDCSTFQAFVIQGKESGELIRVPFREPEEDEILVKVSYVGICGSDLHYYFHGANGNFVIKEPLTPGHEVSGTVELDPRDEFRTGTQVAIFPAQPGTSIPGLGERPNLWHGVRYLGSAATTPHTQGALAQYIYVKRNMVRPTPPGVSSRLAALAEPLAVAIHGVKLAGDLHGKRVLISGSGPIGLLTIVAAKYFGAEHVTATDLFDSALGRAESVGADETINVSQMQLPEEGFDLVFECSGAPKALSNVIKSSKRGGTIVQIGMIASGAQPIEIGLLVTKELRLQGAFRFNDEMDTALEILQNHREVEKSISHIFSLSDIREAFEVAQNAQLSGKVLIEL